MRTFKSLTRVLLKYDLRDWSTLVFTFLVPAGLLVALVLSMRDVTPGVDLAGPISANVLAFGVSFVGIFAGATHLALWRENGMFNVLRSFPIKSGTVIGAQATAGVLLAMAQIVVLTAVAVTPWLGMSLVATAPLALIPLITGYLLFFMLGVLLGIVVPSMAGVSMVAIVVILPLGYIGGAMMPFELLPGWAQAIAPFTPIHHLREAATMPLIGEGTWSAVGVGMAYLAGVTVVLYGIVRSAMRWK